MTESVDDFLKRGGSISQIQKGRSNLHMGHTKKEHAELAKAGKKGGEVIQRQRAADAKYRT